ncbi:MAG: DUF5789 family protein [Halolamina sp.]
MADDDDTEEEPAVELGDRTPVEGAPVARVASRLTWPADAEEVREKEGDAVIRTPAGPRPLTDVLDDANETYFDRRQSFVDAVQSVVGDGPVKTAE